jgi:hypothetical protein
MDTTPERERGEQGRRAVTLVALVVLPLVTAVVGWTAGLLIGLIPGQAVETVAAGTPQTGPLVVALGSAVLGGLIGLFGGAILALWWYARSRRRHLQGVTDRP